MAATYVNEGRVALLENLRVADQAQWRVGLFTAPPTVPVTTVFANMVPVAYTGYAPQTPVFGPAALVGGLGRITAADLTFAPTAPGPPSTAYGYYVYHQSQSKLLFAELFATPKTMTTPADVVVITPYMTENQG